MNRCTYKKHIPFLAIAITLVVIILICVVVHLSKGQSSSPAGGTIWDGDLKSNYDLYIAEEYSGNTNSQTIWHISDKEVKQDIHQACLTISQYREINVAQDIMLGSVADFVYLPQLFFVGKSIGYKMTLLNWENYSGEEWDSWPIKKEAFAEPIICVWRIELTACSEETNKLDYIKSYERRDSLNTEGGMGWYSTMPSEGLEELLALLYQVDGQCAEIVS